MSGDRRGPAARPQAPGRSARCRPAVWLTAMAALAAASLGALAGAGERRRAADAGETATAAAPELTRLPQRVLYAGDPGTERSASFVALLGRHFAAVRSMSVLGLRDAELGDVDVLIVDGELYETDYRNPRFRPAPPGLAPGDLALPTVLIGGRGGQVSDALGLELGLRYG